MVRMIETKAMLPQQRNCVSRLRRDQPHWERSSTVTTRLMTFSITENFAVTPMFKGGMSMVGSTPAALA